jgi:V8-like Glu-specific endopeptidase
MLGHKLTSTLMGSILTIFGLLEGRGMLVAWQAEPSPPEVGATTAVVTKALPVPVFWEGEEATPPRDLKPLDPNDYPPIPLLPSKEEPKGTAARATGNRPVSLDLRARREVVGKIPVGKSGSLEFGNHTVGSRGEVGSLWEPSQRDTQKNFSSLSLVGSPDVYPWRAAVKLLIKVRDTSGTLHSGSCSGTLIDPMHVLTAGHCVYFHQVGGIDFYDWAEEITVVPAYDVGERPYGDAVALQLHSWTGWTDDEDSDHDYGLIDLDRAVGGLVGWLGYGWSDSCDFFTGTNIFRHIGYPGESPYTGELMYTNSGDYDGCDTLFGIWYGNEVQFNSRSYKGQSGSGAHHPSGGCPSCYVYSILSNGNPFVTNDVRLDQAKFNYTSSAIAADMASALDLIPLDVRVGSGTIRPGSQIPSMSYLVHNYSNAAWSGTVGVTVYLSTNSDISTSDTVLQNHLFTWSFEPRGGVRITVSTPPTIPANVSPGTYWVGVVLNLTDANTANNDSDGQDAVKIEVSAGPPSATTEPATVISQTGATLRGTVNANGATTTVYFDYGLTTSYGTTATFGSIGAGTSALTVGQAVSGLLCGRVYHFRVRAVSSAGTASGSDRSFQTASCSVVRNPDTTGVFRPSNGALYLKNQNTSGFADVLLTYGLPGDYPVAGDWNGDGVDTIGVYRNGTFHLRNSNTNGFADLVASFGAAGDQPVVGDWNGDGIDTIGIYRNGTFYLRNSNTSGSAEMTFSLGIPGDVGIAGDWNGDGVVTTGVFRPSNGALYLKNANSTGFADIVLTYGLPGDKPVTGDWNGDGVDTIGIYRGGTFHLRNANTNGFADLVFSLGLNGDYPIAGDWNGLP